MPDAPAPSTGPTGVTIAGSNIDALGIGDELDPAIAAQIDMNDPAIASVLGRWQARENGSQPPATPAQRDALTAPEVPDDFDPETEDPEAGSVPAPETGETSTEELPPAAETPAPDAPDAPDAPSAPPAPIRVTVAGQEIDVDAATIAAWGELAAWTTSLPESTRQTYAGIDAGQLVAIPRSEAEAYLAWQRGQQPGTQPQQQPTRRELEDMDPEDRIAVLEQQLAEMRGEAPVAAAEAARRAVQVQQEQEALVNVIAHTAVEFGEERGLDEDRLGVLLDYVHATGLSTRFSQEGTVVGPNGAVIRQADPAQVMRRALDVAYQQITSIAGPIVSAEVAGRADAAIAAETARAAAVESKKGVAAQMGAAPNAAVTKVDPPRDPSKPMQMHEMEADIAAYLADLQSTDPNAYSR